MGCGVSSQSASPPNGRLSRKSCSVVKPTTCVVQQSEELVMAWKAYKKSLVEEKYAPPVKVFVGAPLTLLEACFDYRSSCPSCGNTGVSLEGRFCKCPYGRRRPPARLTEGKVIVDVGPLHIGEAGRAVVPKMKLGIRGPFVSEGSARCRVPDPSWPHTYMSYAATGSTLTAVLEQVEAHETCPSALDLIWAMPEILYAIRRGLRVDLEEESRQAAMASSGDGQLHASGVVYTFSSCVGAEKFLAWLDLAGYDSIDCEGAGLRVSGLTMKAYVSHGRRTVRVSVYQSRSMTGFDAIVKLRRQAPELFCQRCDESEVLCGKRG